MSSLDERLRTASDLTVRAYTDSPRPAHAEIPRIVSRRRFARLVMAGACAAAAAGALVVLPERRAGEQQAPASGANLDPAVREVLADFPDLLIEMSGSTEVGEASALDALLVLPDLSSGFDVSNGSTQLMEGPTPNDASGLVTQTSTALAFAAVVDGGFERISHLSVASSPPEYEDYQPEPIELGTGSALLYRQPFLTLVQQRGESWIIGIGGPGVSGTATQPVADLSALINAVVVDSDGQLSMQSDVAGLVEFPVTTVLNPPTTGQLRSTYLETGAGWVVETFVDPGSVFWLAALSADRLVPANIRGREGWLATRQRESGSDGVALVWEERPSQWIAASGEGSIDEIRELAESLRVVDKDAWAEVFPEDPGMSSVPEQTVSTEPSTIDSAP